MATAWTKIAKASGQSWTKVAKAVDSSGGGSSIVIGTPIGLLIALTYATASSTPGTSLWTKVLKASGQVWTKVAKAT